MSLLYFILYFRINILALKLLFEPYNYLLNYLLFYLEVYKGL